VGLFISETRRRERICSSVKLNDLKRKEKEIDETGAYLDGERGFSAFQISEEAYIFK
jgi:hypothetical protein